jgi:hypothetical protein
MAIETNGLLNIGLDSALATIENNPLASAAGAALGGFAIGVGASALVGSLVKRKSKRNKRKSSRKRGSRIKHTKRGWKQDRARRSKQKWEVAYQKRKRKGKRVSKKSKRGVHYTKNGQPYKIMSNGRARFIKRRKR